MKASWFCISNKSPESLEIDIFDEIGVYGVTARDFVTALKSKAGGVKELVININTPGGDCNEGFTIFDAIKELKDSGVFVTANITGLAASMGSVIMLPVNKSYIAENGRVMIHRVAAGAYGNADELDAVSKVAKQFEDRIVGLYVAKTGKSEDEIREMMKTPVGTWFFGEEAVEAGFVDGVIKGAKAKAFLPKWADKFAMLPAALFDNGEVSELPKPATNPMNKILLALAAALSIKIENGASEEQIAAAFAAYKPAQVTAELNLEDAETRTRFDDAVALSVKAQLEPLIERLKTAETELTNLRTAASNGMMAAAASGTATGSATTVEKSEDKIAALQSEMLACKDAKERGRLAAQIKKLKDAA